MQCPHCLIAIFVERDYGDDATSGDGEITKGMARLDYIGVNNQNSKFWWSEIAICPNCENMIVCLVSSDRARKVGYNNLPGEETEQKIPVWPRHTARSPVPLEVPNEYGKDYREACLIFADSTNASAALSRRCLQLILREKLGAPKDTLYKEIQWAINSAGLPSSVTDVLDAPRKIGNKAAHPTLSDAGMLVDVEPWEAEWCLEVIEVLYDHLFVIPARNDERLKRLGLT